MKIIDFYWFKDKEKDKPCLVAGLAPNIKNFPYKRFEGVYITMGDGPFRLSKYFKADYWINANSIYPIPEEHLKSINSQKDTVFLFADSVCYSNRKLYPNFLNDNLEVDWYSFDQRHFQGTPCSPKDHCCQVLDAYPDRKTLQEYIQDEYNEDTHYSSGSTVAVHALALAIYMGCNPIYLHGIEIPLYQDDYKYVEDKRADKVSGTNATLKSDNIFKKIRNVLYKYGVLKMKTDFYHSKDEIISDFRYLVKLAQKNGIEVKILSTTSTLCCIPELKYLNPGDI